MLRFWTTFLMLLLAPLASTGAEVLKPKFGDIDGVFYADVSGDREACRQTVKRMVVHCLQNTTFISNTLNREYPECLPIFTEQSQWCADHFRNQTFKCDGSGEVRIDGFTDFACTVTVVEEGEEPEDTPGIAPADRWMQARTRTNVRSGPGTDHARVGLLEVGERVHVTGEAGEWLRIEVPDGSMAFVHGSLLTEMAPEAADQAEVKATPESRDATAALSPKCVGMSEGAECWIELADRPGCFVFSLYYSPPETATWSGECQDGLAVGQGTLGREWESASRSVQATGTLVRGKEHGHWVLRWADEGWADGDIWEGPFVDGKLHGHWVLRYADGGGQEGPYVDSKRHGHWIMRYADGSSEEWEYRNGELLPRN